MRVSRSEFEAVVRKAARGANWPPALAEDLSHAAGALAASGGHGGALALTIIDTDQRTALAECISALELAIGGASNTLTNVPDDLLDACVLSIGAEHHIGFDITRSGDHCEIRPVPFQDKPVYEIDVSEDTWGSLQTFAAKSYVPASAASRLAGAGAGLTDND